MSEADTTKHAIEPRHCEVSDLFSITGDTDEAKAVIDGSAEYLRQFAAPVKSGEGKTVCFHCGSNMDAMLHALGVGAAYEWDLAHGEARCSKCKWPARGMHYPKDANGVELWSARNLFLAYHPDMVEAARPELAA